MACHVPAGTGPRHRSLAALGIALATTACGGVAPPPCKPDGTDAIYVVGRGWHAEIGIPVEQLDGPLGFYRTVFPGARVVMFGYGKKTFITAPATTLAEYVLGPFPGPAVIQVTGLAVTPLQAYEPGSTIRLAMPPGGDAALSAAIWNDLAKDQHGAPRLVSLGHHPVSVFYASRSGYSLLHTCNTWTANLLHAAGLGIATDGVVFSDQVMARAAAVAAAQCPASTTR